MPSNRRIKVFAVFILAVVLITLFVTSSQRAARDSNAIYDKTKSALEKANSNFDDESDEAVAKALADRVQEAAKAAKDSANKKAPFKPDSPADVVGVGNAAEGNGVGSTEKDRNVAGRKKFPIDDGKVQEPIKEQTEEEKDIEAELNTILKRSPIIIFSKSTCPHSRRAKGILLEKYSIVPAPFVVELDLHPLGPGLQAHLAKTTGRKTVPNILINGKSIGGGDEVAELDARRTLIDKVKTMGGKRMVEVIERRA